MVKSLSYRGTATEAGAKKFCIRSVATPAMAAGQAGSLIFDRSGNLYGTTFTGGTDGAGIVFELVPQPDGTWTEGVLHSFTGSDGGAPTAALIFDNSGNLYGTASEGGGTHADGVVFELSPQGNGTWMLDVLHVFLANGSDGFSPGGELLFDSAGNLYGTTSSGGAYDEGTVFELTPNGKKWTETILHSFKQDGIDGRGPNSALITDSAGNLYGTTVYGGVDDQGVVFQLQPGGGGSWNEVVLHSFKLRDGMQPYAGLILDRAGNLYGTTWRGGGGGKGTVFKLKPTGTGRWTETVLHSFRNHPGSYPRGGVIRDAHGNVYGASHGDNKKTFGSVFKITP